MARSAFASTHEDDSLIEEEPLHVKVAEFADTHASHQAFKYAAEFRPSLCAIFPVRQLFLFSNRNSGLLGQPIL